MSPKRVIEQAMSKEIDIVGICDHNSAENVRAAQRFAANKSITVLAGMEIMSAEEVHIVALFDRVDDVLKLQDNVYCNLMPGENKPEIFGEQIIANELDEVVGYNKRLLLGATTLGVKDWVLSIHSLNGLAIASHVDRESFSIIGQLGFIPDDLMVDALEISSNISCQDALKKFPQIKNYNLVATSDAHFLQDIGKKTTAFYLAEPTVAEIKKAFLAKEDRKLSMGKR